VLSTKQQGKIMAAADTKELAQCLAFAYFAENPTFGEPKGNKDSDHAI